MPGQHPPSALRRSQRLQGAMDASVAPDLPGPQEQSGTSSPFGSSHGLRRSSRLQGRDCSVSNDSHGTFSSHSSVTKGQNRRNGRKRVLASRSGAVHGDGTTTSSNSLSSDHDSDALGASRANIGSEAARNDETGDDSDSSQAGDSHDLHSEASIAKADASDGNSVISENSQGHIQPQDHVLDGIEAGRLPYAPGIGQAVEQEEDPLPPPLPILVDNIANLVQDGSDDDNEGHMHDVGVNPMLMEASSSSGSDVSSLSQQSYDDGDGEINNGGADDNENINAYNQNLLDAGLVAQTGINPLLRPEQIVARLGRSVFSFQKHTRKMLTMVKKLCLIGWALLHDHKDSLTSIDERNALLLVYSSPSVMQALSTYMQKTDSDDIKVATLHAMEMLPGTLFDRDDPNTPLGENFDVSVRPLQQLLATAHRFVCLICTLAPDLLSDEVPFVFKNNGGDPLKKISEQMKLRNLGRAHRILSEYDMEPGQAHQHEANQNIMDEATIRKLFEDLHPCNREPDFSYEQAIDDLEAARESNAFPNMPEVATDVPDGEFMSTLKAVDKNSSSGPDGWTYSLLIRVSPQEESSYMGHWFRRGLVRQVSAILCCRIANAERQILTTGKVCFIPKGRDQPGKYRPLGITSVFARIVGKIVLKRCSAYAVTKLPGQLALGISDGAVLGYQTMQTLAEQGYLIALFDATNAFNMIPRRLIYDQLKKVFPSLLPLFSLFYGSPSRAMLAKGIEVGHIMTGVKQGCCLAMLCFCIAMGPVIKELKEHNSATMRLFNETYKGLHGQISVDLVSHAQCYADDISVAVHTAFVTRDPKDPSKVHDTTPGNRSPWLEKVSAICLGYGIQLNPAKFKALTLAPTNGLNAHLLENERGATVLGFPIGTASFQRAWATKAFNKAARILRLEEGQMTEAGNMLLRLPIGDALALVRSCIITRVLHLCRGLPRTLHPNAGAGLVVGQADILEDSLVQWDACVLSWLRHVLKIPIDALDTQSFAIISHVGVARGGLGLKMLSQFRGITADKLFWDCTNRLIVTCEAMKSRGHLSGALANFLLHHRRAHQLLPGTKLACQPPFMANHGWLQTLYPEEDDQGASVSNTILDKNLLKCLLQQVLNNSSNDPIGDLRYREERWCAVATFLSFQYGNRSMWSLPASGNPRDRLTNKTFLSWISLMFLQRPFPRGAATSRCCGTTTLDRLNSKGSFHSLCCQKQQGGAVKRHDAVVSAFHDMFTELFGHSDDLVIVKEPMFSDYIGDHHDSTFPVTFGVTTSRNLRNRADGTRTVTPAYERRADLLIIVNGIHYFIDACVVIPYNRKRPKPVHGAEVFADDVKKAMLQCRSNAAREKHSDIAKHLPRQDAHPTLRFHPFALDIGGGADKATMDFLKELAPLESANRPIVDKYLRIIAKIIARTTVQLSWWPTVRRLTDELYEYDSDANDDDNVLAHVDSDSEISFEQGIPPEVALMHQLQANLHDHDQQAPWLVNGQGWDNAQANAVGLGLLAELNDPPAPLAVVGIHDFINQNPFGQAAPAAQANLDDDEAALPAVEAASDSDSENSSDQEIPPEVALQHLPQANPDGPNLQAPWQQFDQEDDNAQAHAVGSALLDQLNDAPAPLAAGVFHDLIIENPFGPAAPAVDVILDAEAAFPPVEAASDDDDGGVFVYI